MNIDSRCTWLKITNANTYPRYEITDIAFEDETQSGGNHNVYAEVYDENGRPEFGLRVFFNTTDEQNPASQTLINGATNFPMSPDSSFDPSRGESGPYYIQVDAYPSDRVTGMGLRLRRHENYRIRWQKVLNGTPPIDPPTEPPSSDNEDTKYLRLRLARAARAFAADLERED